MFYTLAKYFVRTVLQLVEKYLLYLQRHFFTRKWWKNPSFIIFRRIYTIGSYLLKQIIIHLYCVRKNISVYIHMLCLLSGTMYEKHKGFKDYFIDSKVIIMMIWVIAPGRTMLLKCWYQFKVLSGKIIDVNAMHRNNIQLYFF